MTMWRVLLAKDLKRTWRNPVPWITNLALPLCITALVGLAFGSASDSGALGRIRFAIVDEDGSVLTQFLRGAVNQEQARKYLDLAFLKRDDALRDLMDNKLSAVLTIPPHFTRDYLTGRQGVRLELLKNPAQSIHPAVLEELLDLVVTALNALARNFQPELSGWETLFRDKADFRTVSKLMEQAGDKLEAARHYLNPPLVTYEKDTEGGALRPGKPDGTKPARPQPGAEFNLFAYLLVGMAGMFLLFIASHAMTDLNRELRLRTFERYHTLHHSLVPFIGGKVVFAIVLLMLCAAILLGGGALIFGIRWRHPAALLGLTFGYVSFAAALMAVLVAVIPSERRAGALNSILAMALGMAGGCAFPPEALPAFLREHVTPLLPTFWFTSAARGLERAASHPAWWIPASSLLGLGLLLIGLAALLFRQRFRTGARA